MPCYQMGDLAPARFQAAQLSAASINDGARAATASPTTSPRKLRQAAGGDVSTC